MATLDFADIEDLIVAKLTADVTAAKSVTTYAGQLDDLVEGRLIKGFPLVTVMFSGQTLEQIDGPNHHAVAEFTVAIFAHSLRGADDTRKGAAGAYALVRDVLDSLVNARLAENLEPVAVTNVQLIYATPAVMAYQVAFSVAMDQEYQWPE